MKQENKLQRKNKESKLNNLLSFATGLSLTALHSSTIYHLMDRAGMYEFTPGVGYEQLMSLEGAVYQITGMLGGLALFCGGLLGTNWLLNRKRR